MSAKEIAEIREALEGALREHNEFMAEADLPIGSKRINNALAALARLEAQRPKALEKLNCNLCTNLDTCGRYEACACTPVLVSLATLAELCEDLGAELGKKYIKEWIAAKYGFAVTED
jgi:hypothetical protein